MITTPTPRALACLLLSLAAAGCGDTRKMLTVAGHKLIVEESSFGETGGATMQPTTYCMPLDSRGQFEVIIMSAAFCGQVRARAKNEAIFHTGETANLRMIFSSALMKTASGGFKINEFKVGSTDSCKNNTGQATGAAFFSHNRPGFIVYDVSVEATSGTIKVTDYTAGSVMRGNYDLNFPADHITGDFEATFCPGLDANYGR